MKSKANMSNKNNNNAVPDCQEIAFVKRLSAFSIAYLPITAILSEINLPATKAGII